MNDHIKRHYLISIDGGGTKTGFSVFDSIDQTVRSYVCGGGNYKTHGIDIVRERIRSGLLELLPEASDIAAETEFLVMGLSGCDSLRDFEVYTELMQSMGFDSERMFICNDSEMFFRSHFEAPGLCAIAGTGTIVLAFQTDGSVVRAGGWGAPISDEGSGYWIGAEIVRAYLNWIDGIGDNNPFFARFPEALHCASDEEAASLLAAMHPAEIAEWAMPVFEAASENALCLKIIETAAEKTAILAASAFRKGGFSPEAELNIAESGGLFKNAVYARCFQNRLKGLLSAGHYHFHHFDGMPAEDGIRLAKKMAEKLVTTQSRD